MKESNAAKLFNYFGGDAFREAARNIRAVAKTYPWGVAIVSVGVAAGGYVASIDIPRAVHASAMGNKPGSIFEGALAGGALWVVVDILKKLNKGGNRIRQATPAS